MNRMVVAGVLTAAILAGNPYQVHVAAALADAQSVSPASRSQLLYLLAQGEDDLPAVSYAINAVSRTRVIRQPKIVGPNLLRVQLAWLYGTDSKAAKEILKAREALSEGYFTTLDATGQIRLGLSPEYAQLQQVCYSAIPLMRADAFVAQVLGEAKHYYAWLGTPRKQVDFYRGLGLDVSLVEGITAQLEASIGASKITEADRIVLNMNAPLGPVLVTLDVDKEKQKTRTNNRSVAPAILPKGYRFQFDAQEVFALKSNGFWQTALFNAKGERQNAVPPGIATDRYGTSGHGEVVPGISCFRCHEREGNASIQPFKDAQVLVPSVGHPDDIERLSATHDADRMADFVTLGGQIYIKAISRATAGFVKEGQHQRAMLPTEATDAVVGVYEQFIAPVTLQTAAREMGLPEAEAVQRLKAAGAYNLAGNETVTRDEWETTWRAIQW